jgi:hypothetical protein
VLHDLTRTKIEFKHESLLHPSQQASDKPYVVFFSPALTFAHRARCAAAILLRGDANMVRVTAADSDWRGLWALDEYPQCELAQ